MADEKKVNVRVKDGEQFYSNEMAVHVNPNEVILDFKCITQLQDVGDHSAMLIRHNPIIMTPQHAKSFYEIMTKVIKEYEKKFGTIEKTKYQKKADALIKKLQKDKKVSKKIKAPVGESYFG